MGLVGDDEIGIEGQQFIFKPPSRFIIHDNDLKRLHLGFRQLLPLLGTTAREDGDFMGEIGEPCIFLLPHAQDAERSDYQHPLDLARFSECAGDGDADQRFAAAHFEEQGNPTAFDYPVLQSEQPTGKVVSSLLVGVGLCPDGHGGKFRDISYHMNPPFGEIGGRKFISPSHLYRQRICHQN